MRHLTGVFLAAVAAFLAAPAGAIENPARVAPPPPIGADSEGMFFISYPDQALRLKEQGTSHYAVKIDEQGLPLDCTIVESSGYKRLDDLTCATVVHHARFIVPKNENGGSRKANYRGKVIWSIR